MQELLTKVGKKLRKSNVSIDVVSFGECAAANKEVLEAFVAAVNKDSNSHFVEAPLGANLCDFLLSSPVVRQGGDGGGGAGSGGSAAAGGCSSFRDLRMLYLGGHPF
jgi:26S proteasome regulatory subunit N10